jgi:hypothetical protein
MTQPPFVPHKAVHRPFVFICGSDPDDSAVTFTENPAARIASGLLEDIGDWYTAIRAVQQTEIPPAVTEALGALHEAVCGWTDWTARRPA